MIASTDFISQFLTSYEDFTTSSIFTFAFLDLIPSTEDVKKSDLYDRSTNSGRGVTVNPLFNLLIFSKEVKEVESELKDNIMVIHRYFDIAD
jgi:hypothetical protein